ncbi:unnamed protein product, partial [Ectocarpus fasciculatus]
VHGWARSIGKVGVTHKPSYAWGLRGHFGEDRRGAWWDHCTLWMRLPSLHKLNFGGTCGHVTPKVFSLLGSPIPLTLVCVVERQPLGGCEFAAAGWYLAVQVRVGYGVWDAQPPSKYCRAP